MLMSHFMNEGDVQNQFITEATQAYTSASEGKCNMLNTKLNKTNSLTVK